MGPDLFQTGFGWPCAPSFSPLCNLEFCLYPSSLPEAKREATPGPEKPDEAAVGQADPASRRPWKGSPQLTLHLPQQMYYYFTTQAQGQCT